MEDLKKELKLKIIEALKLEDVESKDIENDAPLFEKGLGLDSIDALELSMILDKDYGIIIENGEQGKEIFSSINSMTKFVSDNRKH